MATINEAYACYVYWRETDIAKGAEFIIMWSDGTWETIKTPITTYRESWFSQLLQSPL